MISFKLTNVSTTYRKIINDTLRQYFDIYVIVYLNNILIFSKIYEKYMKHIFKILKYLNKRNLLFKFEKCKFHKIEMKF